MKKHVGMIIFLLVIAVMLFAMTACGGDSNTPASSGGEPVGTTAEQLPTAGSDSGSDVPDPSETSGENSSSHSADSTAPEPVPAPDDGYTKNY